MRKKYLGYLLCVVWTVVWTAIMYAMIFVGYFDGIVYLIGLIGGFMVIFWKYDEPKEPTK